MSAPWPPPSAGAASGDAIEAVLDVLSACGSRGAKKVFVLNDREVYGKGARIPFHEDDDSVLGASSLHRWSYACSKLLDEFLATPP